MKLLVADQINSNAITQLESAGFDVVNNPEITAEELASSISDFEILIVRSRTKVPAEIIDIANKLKIIARVGAGTDTIDVAAAAARNIEVINAPGANANAVAELTIGLMLSLLRFIPTADKSTKEGKWLKKQLKGGELTGKTVGIIGYGAIGKKVGALVTAFGANILTHDRDNDMRNLEKLCSESDFITIHSVLTDETRNMINKERLSLMKKTAYLINCARAELIDEQALYDVLSNKTISGAALDVFWDEPITGDNKWTKLDNVILTPHIGGQTGEASQAAAQMIVDKLIEFKQKI